MFDNRAALDVEPPVHGEAASLADVLATLLAFADPRTARTCAERLIAAFGSHAAIGRASRGRLTDLVGRRAADLVIAHRTVMLWALREPAVAGPILATRHDLLEYLHHRMAADAGESMRALFLNGRRELIAEEVVARGGPGGVVVEPRVVIARALDLGATGLLVVHNHPSGDPEPSAADRRFTRALSAAGEPLGIRLHDHLVMARDGHRRVVPTRRDP